MLDINNVAGLGWGREVVYVFVSTLVPVGKRKTHQSPENLGTTLGKLCLCVLLFGAFLLARRSPSEAKKRLTGGHGKPEPTLK